MHSIKTRNVIFTNPMQRIEIRKQHQRMRLHNITRLLIIVVSILNVSTIEAKPKKKRKACVKQDNAMITFGYGAPSIVRAFLKYKTTRDQIEVAGSGPYIFKSEFMITNRFGISTNLSYSQSRIFWYDVGYDTISQSYRDFEFGIKAYELSGTIRGNYHYYKHPKLDAYVGFGFGYGLFNMESYTLAHTTKFKIKYEVPDPLSLEATTGLRYFPLKNLGVYTEVGIGKSWILYKKYFLPEALIQAGLVFKF